MGKRVIYWHEVTFGGDGSILKVMMVSVCLLHKFNKNYQLYTYMYEFYDI
jgi:hypothetical protein